MLWEETGLCVCVYVIETVDGLERVTGRQEGETSGRIVMTTQPQGQVNNRMY